MFDDYEGLIDADGMLWDLLEFIGDILGRGIISW